MVELFSRFTAQVMWQLQRNEGVWLSLEQLEELSGVPEKEAREILTGLFQSGYLQIILKDEEFPANTLPELKTEVNDVLRKHILANDTPIPVGIASFLLYRLSPED